MSDNYRHHRGALDTPVPITFFSTFAATSKTEEPCTPRALADLIRTMTAPRKEALPWLKMARFGAKRTGKGSLRHDANVLAVTGIEADYDGETMSFDAACAVLEKRGVGGIVYTSPSCSLTKFRWRVLAPLSVEVPPARRCAVMGRLNGLFGGIFAGESWTLSQSYYFGSVRANPAHRVELIDGAPIDTHDDLDAVWIGKAGGGVAGKNTDTADAKEPREDAELIRRIITGEGFHAELCALSARYIGRGMSPSATAATLRGVMLSHPDANRNERWRDRYDNIGELVQSAGTKYADAAAVRLELRRKLAGQAIALLRERVDDNDVLACLHEANAASRAPLPVEQVDAIAVWAAKQAGGVHAAR
jgi:hypothetical protein